MRVGTYNVHKLRGFCPDGDVAPLDPEAPETVDFFSAALEQLGCDLLALQEGGSVDQMQRIASELGLGVVTLASPVRWPGYVLARGDLQLVHEFDEARAQDPSSFTRSGGVVAVDVDDRRLVIVAVHLHPHDRDVRAREGRACARVVGELLEGGEDALIVLGDLNCDVDESPHRQLRELGLVPALPDAVLATADTLGVPRRRVDHVYLGPAFAGRAGTARVEVGPGFRSDQPDERVASDHLPVLVDLDPPAP